VRADRGGRWCFSGAHSLPLDAAYRTAPRWFSAATTRHPAHIPREPAGTSRTRPLIPARKSCSSRESRLSPLGPQVLTEPDGDDRAASSSPVGLRVRRTWHFPGLCRWPARPRRSPRDSRSRSQLLPRHSGRPSPSTPTSLACITLRHAGSLATHPLRSRVRHRAQGNSRRRTTSRGDELLLLVGDQESVLELTYNHDRHTYDLGSGYGHIAVRVDDLDGTLASLAEQASSLRKHRTRSARAARASGSSRTRTVSFEYRVNATGLSYSGSVRRCPCHRRPRDQQADVSACHAVARCPRAVSGPAFGPAHLRSIVSAPARRACGTQWRCRRCRARWWP
jgi:hypothetical protein